MQVVKEASGALARLLAVRCLADFVAGSTPWCVANRREMASASLRRCVAWLMHEDYSYSMKAQGHSPADLLSETIWKQGFEERCESLRRR